MSKRQEKNRTGQLEDDENEIASLAIDHGQLSEYELFKLREASKAALTHTASNRSHTSTVVILTIAVVLLIGTYTYLSQEVQNQEDYQAEAPATETLEQIFYYSVKKSAQQSNSEIVKPGTSFSNIFLPAGITDEQMNFAAKLKGLVLLEQPQQSPIADEERAYYVQKYKIDQYEELPFCIVVPTYNNVPDSRYLNNIKSIVMQDYRQYHIVIIDDASSDGTATAILNFLQKQSNVERQRYQIVVNKDRKLAMQNLRRAARQFCQSQQIFLVVDGDDELLGRQVLKLFNAVFQSQKAMFVYSNFITSRSRYGYSRPIPPEILKGNRYRQYPFVTSHLRAFYTKLFQNVREADLQAADGSYFKAANDVAICIPVVEQAGERVYYLPELTYVYNSNTGLNNHRVRQGEQMTNAGLIRKKKPYQPLKTLE